ncbi:Xylosyltransferase oxt [Pseudolycoriella hygida]|uniref:protein xylosyltransferase n=1 Tax=Pseudolycoriella hygida TaxID=35572 RepID=A0A9Q0N207_9DIPT|nr:Xylosyltransferase oxt [Pseudolycoriella hygida]
MTELLAGRWLRRYKLFFIFVLLILCIQLFLAYLLPIFGSTDDIIQATYGSHTHRKKNLRNSASVDDEEISNSNAYSKSKTSKEVKETTGTTKRYQLRLDELEFTPNCDIHTKEAVSAIHRASSQSCKQTIANVACAIQTKTFYADSLPNFCPTGNYTANRSLGCFKDEKNFRVLSGYFMNFKTLNTPSKCIQLCLQSGFQYAGVQYSTQCFCGHNEPLAKYKLPDPECNYKCSGDAKQICGGYFTINVYETGISKFDPQVAEVMPKEDADKVKIAFLLTLNGRAVRQVHRLLKSLYNKNHFYYIHVDERQDYMYRELLKLEAKASNIRLARKRYSTIWGGASLLKMLLAAMTDLLHLHWKWDFVINLSESDFLVKTTDKLVDFLSANRDRNFVKSHGREVQRFIQKQGLDKTFVECDTHMWRVGDRELPKGIQIDGGSDWVALSRDFVEYVTSEEKDELISGLLKIFHHTLLPAESFFHTALRNSKFCGTYVDNNLHVTNWKRRLGCKCQYKHVVDWCGCSPNDFKPEDWQRLLATEQKQVFFARKFEPIINQAVILKIEEWLYGPHPEDPPVPNLHNYWQSLYHHHDVSPKPDDALLSVVKSLIRKQLKTFTNHLLNFVELIEVTTYMENDAYRGFLIHFTASSDCSFEILARPQQVSQAARSSPVGQRIRYLEVSTDFDQKEQISRNFAKIMGPHSEPIVVLHLGPSESDTTTSYNMTIVWINPTGKIADISDLHIEDSNAMTIHFGKTNMKQPLLPGQWVAKIIHRKSILAQCTFVVVPLTTSSIDPAQNDELIETDVYAGSNWNTFALSKNEISLLEEDAIANSRRIGLDLLDWIDSLVDRFFVIKNVCIVDEQSMFDGLPVCRNTSWSSIAPDPKSDIYAELNSLV